MSKYTTVPDVERIVERIVGKAVQELTEVIQSFATHVDRRFALIEAQMVTKNEFNREITRIRSEMVTKDYLDRKIWEVRSDASNEIRDRVDTHEKKWHS